MSYLLSQYIKESVIAAAAAGVKGVTTDKAIGATLADADEMVEVCQQCGVVFGGGNLQRAIARCRLPHAGSKPATSVRSPAPAALHPLQVEPVLLSRHFDPLLPECRPDRE